MSLISIGAPDKILNGEVLKWVAAHHPVIYLLQRSDQQVQIKQTPPGGFVQLILVGTAPGGVQVGDRLKYFTPSGESFIWTIGALAFSGNQIITSDGTIPGTEIGGYVVWLDLFDSYFVEVEVFSINTSNTYVSVGKLNIKSGLEGEIKVNVAKWLQSLAIFENNFDYNANNKAVEGEGGRYSLRFREVIDGVKGTIQTPFAIRYWSNSAKQIQAAFGSNMGDFTPTIDVTRDPQAKFLSVFEKPTYFPGFPFSLNFLYSDNLTNKQITREEDELNVNGGIDAHTSTELDYSQRFFNNRLMIKQTYPSTIKELDVWLQSGDTIEKSELDGGSIYEAGVFESIPASEPTIKPEIPRK